MYTTGVQDKACAQQYDLKASLDKHSTPQIMEKSNFEVKDLNSFYATKVEAYSRGKVQSPHRHFQKIIFATFVVGGEVKPN